MFITYYKKQEEHPQYQISLEDILNGNLTISVHEPTLPIKRTVEITEPELHLEEYNKIMRVVQNVLPGLSAQAQIFLQDDIEKHYHTFKIPKKTKGYRTISAPDEELKELQRQIKYFFETQLKVLTHDAAHAYVKQRSTVTALQVHQKHNSRWFLKLDMKDFFPAHNLQYIMNTLKQIYPFYYIVQAGYEEQLETLIKVCLLNDSLPQGTPVSPTLTNILMTPIDYAIQNMCTEYGRNHAQFMTYTRYADDLLISSTKDFKWSAIEKKLTDILILNSAPFKLNKEKTRYGSCSGRNWNNGIMYNKDKQLTIGHKNNQKFRAALQQFISDNLTPETKWDILTVQQFLGKVAYYKSIEPQYISFVINKYSTKFHIDFDQFSKDLIHTS